tara:strand:- start:3424 stop:4170 length:747 start_codon:yes stop_codon:yes gene_type:complete
MDSKTYKYNTKYIWENLNLIPSDETLQKLFRLHSLLIELNQFQNLTRIIKNNEYWILHIFDSLWPLKNEINNSENITKYADIGSGCGIPGLVIALFMPSTEVFLIDSSKRKTDAIQTIINKLKLSDRVHILNERVELTGRRNGFRESFDLVTARAVASSPVVAEYIIPLLNNSGKGIIYCGQWNDTSTINLNKTLVHLGGKISSISNIDLPKQKGIRNVVKIIKDYKCPDNYPRGIGIANKRPLSLKD